MGKKKVEVRIFDFIYERLECIAKYIGVPEEVIINNWLIRGCEKDWGIFTDDIEDLNKEKKQGKELQKRLANFLDTLADHYYEENEAFKEFDFQERFAEKYLDSTTFKEDDKFHENYFSDLKKRRGNKARRVDIDEEKEQYLWENI